MREPILKSEGSTVGERLLSKFSEETFLELWSYPSPYRNQRNGDVSHGDGKELCDLLVVCGNEVIIFSEKNIEWPSGDITVAWSRWFKRAVTSSAKQVLGAERWLIEHPNRVFLDRRCENPFPITLPNNRNGIHLIVVARGAEKKCRNYFDGHSGSLKINIEGNKSSNLDNLKNGPFLIGDINQPGSFIHVFDSLSIETILKDLNTISDFTNYLKVRKLTLRSGQNITIDGEENFLAGYMHSTFKEPERRNISLSRCNYYDVNFRHDMEIKKKEDEISYVWDNIISSFSSGVLKGTSILLGETDYNFDNSEIALRHMALQSRIARRVLGKGVVDGLNNAIGEQRFFRLLISPNIEKFNETAFFILTLRYMDWMKKIDGKNTLIEARHKLAGVYAQAILEKYRKLKNVVGITFNEPNNLGSSSPCELIYGEQQVWSKKEIVDLKKNCRALGVFQDTKPAKHVQESVFPNQIENIKNKPFHNAPNRRARRQKIAQLRKNKK